MSVTANERQKFEFEAHQSGSTPEAILFHIHVGHIPGIAGLAKDGACYFIQIFWWFTPCVLSSVHFRSCLAATNSYALV